MRKVPVIIGLYSKAGRIVLFAAYKDIGIFSDLSVYFLALRKSANGFPK